MTDPIFPDHVLFQDDLKAYVDGELSWLRRLAVRRHLTHCASCREEIVQMTQIAEDLRESEIDTTLDPTLRAKILGIQEPTPPQAATLPKREGEEQDSEAYHTPPLRPPASGGPLRSDLSRSKEVGSRKRPALPWLLAGAAVLAWFALFPTFQKSRDETTASSPAIALSTPLSSLRSRYMPVPSGAGGSYPGNHGAYFATPSSPQTSPLADPQLSARQVHKEAAIGVQVANPEAASDQVETMVKEAGGFVANNTLNTSGDGLKSANMTVKVPVAQFEAVLSQIAKLGSVQSKNVTGEDITDKSSDADQTENILESDVQTSEARLKALGPKAKWSDQQTARDLRTQLAQARARIFLLKRMAALSTITVDLSQTPKAAAPVPVTNGFTDGLKANTHDALQSLLSSASTLLALVIWLLAYAPIWVPLLLVGRYGLREYRKRT